MITPTMEVAPLLPSENNNKRGRKSTKVYGYTLPRQIGPTMSAFDAVEYINSHGEDVSRQWLLKQARDRGPEGYDGVLGWVKMPYNSSEDGDNGWYPRHMYTPKPNERLAVWFDKEELDRWIEARKESLANTLEKEKELDNVEVPNDVRERIFQHMPEARDDDGGVNRTLLRDILMRTYNYSERYIYLKVRRVARDEQWPYTKDMPRRPRFNLKQR